jgi:prevent-host-death family protein
MKGVLLANLQYSNTVGAYEAKTHLSKLLEKVEAGEEITITKHGAPVAKLVPVKKEVSAEQRVAAIERIQKLATGLSLGGLKVKDLINEGRR